MKEIVEQAYDGIRTSLESYSNWGLTSVAQQEIVIKNALYNVIEKIKVDNIPSAEMEKKDFDAAKNQCKNFITKALFALNKTLMLEMFIQTREDVGIEKIFEQLASQAPAIDNIAAAQQAEFLKTIAVFTKEQDVGKICDFISTGTEKDSNSSQKQNSSLNDSNQEELNKTLENALKSLPDPTVTVQAAPVPKQQQKSVAEKQKNMSFADNKELIIALTGFLQKMIPNKNFELGSRFKNAISKLKKAEEAIDVNKKSSVIPKEDKIKTIVTNFLEKIAKIINDAKKIENGDNNNAAFVGIYRQKLEAIVRCFNEAMEELKTKQQLNTTNVINLLSQARYYNNQMNTPAKMKANNKRIIIDKDLLLKPFVLSNHSQSQSDCPVEKVLIKTQHDLLNSSDDLVEMSDKGNASFEAKIEKQKIILKCLIKVLTEMASQDGFWKLSSKDESISLIKKEKLAFSNYQVIIDNARYYIDKLRKNANTPEEKIEKMELNQTINKDNLENGTLKALLLAGTETPTEERSSKKVKGDDSEVELMLLRIRSQEPALFDINQIVAKIESVMPVFKSNFTKSSFFKGTNEAELAAPTAETVVAEEPSSIPSAGQQ